MPRQIHLLLDFDGTLTTRDTLSVLTSLSPSLKHSPSESPPQHPSWPSITEAYISDIRAHASAYVPAKSDRKSLSAELAYLESLAPMERASIQRVEDAGVFVGVGSSEVADGAKRAVRDGRVVLRDGWTESVTQVRGHGGVVDVISVNWSRGFVGGCLREAWKARNRNDGGEDATFDGLDIGIYANEIKDSETGKLSRYFQAQDRGIWTAGDKRRVLRHVVDSRRQVKGEEYMTVYVGDSLTDLACLCAADVGVCFRGEESSELVETVERIGVKCGWIGDLGGVGLGKPGETALWWAKDFGEVESGLFGC